MKYKIGDKVRLTKISKKRYLDPHIRVIENNLNCVFEIIKIDDMEHTLMPIRVKITNDFYMWLYKDEFEIIENKETLENILERIEKINKEIKKLEMEKEKLLNTKFVEVK
jgi:hypothetical protein